MADDDTNTGQDSAKPETTRNPAISTQATHVTQEKTRQTAEQTKHDTRELAHKAQAQAKSMLVEQKQAAAGQVEGFAKALRKTSEQLDAQDQGTFARYVESAAEGLDSLSSTLRDQDVEHLATQVQDYARRQPAVFIGGAIAAGFLVARFLKSSPSVSLSAPSSSPSNEPYAGTSTDEPYSKTPRQQSGSTTT